MDWGNIEEYQRNTRLRDMVNRVSDLEEFSKLDLHEIVENTLYDRNPDVDWEFELQSYFDEVEKMLFKKGVQYDGERDLYTNPNPVRPTSEL
jgi:hypothetical protein